MDIGQYGSGNDCSVLKNSGIERSMETNAFQIPGPRSMDGMEKDIPFFFSAMKYSPLKNGYSDHTPDLWTNLKRYLITDYLEPDGLLY